MDSPALLCVSVSLWPIFISYRENGYISQAIPTPITKNSASDHNATLNLAPAECLPKLASATDTHAANVTMAAK
jgi:hypothetical protein